MPLIIRFDDLVQVQRHAADTYPAEACGGLVGREHGPSKHVTQTVRLRNEADEHSRYFANPLDLLHLEQSVREQSLRVLGYYHSHPDCPAAPSETDRELAWPVLCYLIVPVLSGMAGEPKCWVLRPDGSEFVEEPVSVET